jgi:hypothetical protein
MAGVEILPAMGHDAKIELRKLIQKADETLVGVPDISRRLFGSTLRCPTGPTP